MGYLGDRVTSSFPISIGTAIALEACFDPVSQVYKPEREMPKRIDLTKYNTVLINIATLVRNIHSSVSSDIAKKLSAMEVAEVLMQEVEVITELFSKHVPNIRIHFYSSNYDRLDSKYKKAILKESKTPNQIEYDLLLTKSQEYYWKNFLEEDRNIYKCEIKYHEKDSQILLISHMVYDLANILHVGRLDLLESYTGSLKSRDQWFTKFHQYKNQLPNIERIPFYTPFVIAFGDGQLFRPFPDAARKVILDHAAKSDWNAYTTISRIKFSLQYLPDAYLAAVLAEFW